jgi:hypothetical protein
VAIWDSRSTKKLCSFRKIGILFPVLSVRLLRTQLGPSILALLKLQLRAEWCATAIKVAYQNSESCRGIVEISTFVTEARTSIFTKHNVVQCLSMPRLAVPPLTIFKPRLEPRVLITLLIQCPVLHRKVHAKILCSPKTQEIIQASVVEAIVLRLHRAIHC